MVTDQNAMVTDQNAMVTYQNAMVTDQNAMVTNQNAMVTDLEETDLIINGFKLDSPSSPHPTLSS